MMDIHPAATMAAEWWAHRLMRGDKARFVEWLSMIVHTELHNNGHCFLECDYDPDKHLLSALNAAGVECLGFMFSADGILPQKHSLDVFPDRLEPKEGYGNWAEAIPVPAQAGVTRMGSGERSELARDGKADAPESPPEDR